MNIYQLTEHSRLNEATIEFLRQRGILRAQHMTVHPYVLCVDMKWLKQDVKAEAMGLHGVTINGREH